MDEILASVAHRALSAQPSSSSSSSSEEEDSSTSLVLPLSLSNANAGDDGDGDADDASNSSTDSVTSSNSCDSDDTASALSTTDEFTSSSSVSASFEELKLCHDLQNPTDLELTRGNGYPCGKIMSINSSSISDYEDVQGVKGYVYSDSMRRTTNLGVICGRGSDDDDDEDEVDS